MRKILERFNWWWTLDDGDEWLIGFSYNPNVQIVKENGDIDETASPSIIALGLGFGKLIYVLGDTGEE